MDHRRGHQRLPGYRIARYLGIARGIPVRSRSVVSNVGSIQALFGVVE